MIYGIYSSCNIECDWLKLVIMRHFLNFEKMKKIAGDIIILQMRTKNHNHMRYGSSDTEWETKCFVILGRFLPFYPPNSLENLKKWKQHLEMSSFYTYVPKITIIWFMIPEIWRVTDIIFSNSGPIFARLTHYWPRKLKFGKM